MILQARDDCGNLGFLPCPLDAVKGIHRPIGFQVSQDLLKLRKRDDTSGKGHQDLLNQKHRGSRLACCYLADEKRLNVVKNTSDVVYLDEYRLCLLRSIFGAFGEFCQGR